MQLCKWHLQLQHSLSTCLGNLREDKLELQAIMSVLQLTKIVLLINRFLCIRYSDCRSSWCMLPTIIKLIHGKLLASSRSSYFSRKNNRMLRFGLSSLSNFFTPAAWPRRQAHYGTHITSIIIIDESGFAKVNKACKNYNMVIIWEIYEIY